MIAEILQSNLHLKVSIKSLTRSVWSLVTNVINIYQNNSERTICSLKNKRDNKVVVNRTYWQRQVLGFWNLGSYFKPYIDFLFLHTIGTIETRSKPIFVSYIPPSTHQSKIIFDIQLMNTLFLRQGQTHETNFTIVDFTTWIKVSK